MSPKYKKSPIVEALCEFQFLSDQKWDITYSGIIYEKIKNQFPQKKQISGFQSDFLQKQGRIEHNVKFAPKIQFQRSDKSALIQLSENTISINHFQPYPIWHKFKALILENFNIYCEVVKPTSLRRIGLRYINKVEFNIDSFKLPDYFKFYPIEPDDFKYDRDSFTCRSEYPDKNKINRLIIAVGSIFSQAQNSIAILLDLDYIMSKSDTVTLDDTENWLERAHSIIEKTFESCITDKYRDLIK